MSLNGRNARGIKTTIESWTDQYGRVLLSSEQVCAVFLQYFALLIGVDDESTTVASFTSYLSIIDAKFCEKPITAIEIREKINDCTGRKSPGLDALFNEFYVFIPDFFGSILADIYTN